MWKPNMGCDVHVVAERREDGAWRRIFPPKGRFNWYPRMPQPPGSFWNNVDEYSWYQGRNYEPFTILAGVRSVDGIPTISEPRGLPDDISAETFACTSEGHAKERERLGLSDDDDLPDDIWLGDHSHSWLALAELNAFDWSHAIDFGYGIVSFASFASGEYLDSAYEDSELAREAFSSVIKKPEADALLKRTDAAHVLKILGDGYASTGVTFRWIVPLSYAAGTFYTETIPALRDEVRGGDSDGVRIVFGFDS